MRRAACFSKRRFRIGFFLGARLGIDKERERLAHLQLLIDRQVVPKSDLFGVDAVLLSKALPGVFGPYFVADFPAKLFRRQIQLALIGNAKGDVLLLGVASGDQQCRPRFDQHFWGYVVEAFELFFLDAQLLGCVGHLQSFRRNPGGPTGQFRTGEVVVVFLKNLRIVPRQ